MSRTATIFIILVTIGFTGLFLLLRTVPAKPIPDLSVLGPTPTTEVVKLITVAPSATAQQVLPTATPIISPTKAPATSLIPKANKAIIKTSKGDITLSFYGKDAPNTVTNFVQKSQSGFYNNLTFHRVEDWVVQGGDPKGDGTGGGEIPTEINDRPFTVGSVGVARRNDIKVSNDSQFFIAKTDASWLTGQYTNFGIVTDGMNVINTIEVGDKILSVSIE